MEYTLVYGFRRYSACKKLGWKQIPCFIKETGQIIEIPINEIHLMEKNTRLNQHDENFHQLMQSIHENGLLHPLGVTNVNELKKEEFITTNLIENIHRQNESPFELSVACNRLKEEGLSNSEISIRLSQPKSRIEGLMHLSRDLKEELKESSFVGENKRKKVKLPFAILNRISTFRTSQAERKKLIKIIKKEELTLRQVDLIINFCNNGMPLEKAVESLEKYLVVNPRIVINKKKLKEKNEIGLSPGNFVNLILKRQEPSLFYYNK